MAWLSPFILGRPGLEISFDVNPAAMTMDPAPVRVVQMNLAGDKKKSVVKKSAPEITIKSNYLTLAQLNAFFSVMQVQDTFLSFQTRDDWQVVNELVQVLTLTSVQIGNSSATRLSAVLTALGLSSQITIITPFTYLAAGGYGYGLGGFGMGGFGGGGTFDPGVVTYNDATRVISFTNPLPSLTQPVFVSYTYKGWLVDLETFPVQATGGHLDIHSYSFKLVGA